MKNIKFIFFPVLFLLIIFYYVSNYEILIVDKSKLFTNLGKNFRSLDTFNFLDDPFSHFSAKLHSYKTMIYRNTNEKMFFANFEKDLTLRLLNSNSNHYLESKVVLNNILSDYLDYKNFEDRFLLSINNKRFTFLITNKDYQESNKDILRTFFLVESIDSRLRMTDCLKIYRKFDQIFFENCYTGDVLNSKNVNISNSDTIKLNKLSEDNADRKVLEKFKYNFHYFVGLKNLKDLSEGTLINQFYQFFLMISIMVISLINIFKFLLKK